MANNNFAVPRLKVELLRHYNGGAANISCHTVG